MTAKITSHTFRQHALRRLRTGTALVVPPATAATITAPSLQYRGRQATDIGYGVIHRLRSVVTVGQLSVVVVLGDDRRSLDMSLCPQP